MKNIIIIGTGWYGCHIANLLRKYENKFNIILIDEHDEIFLNSSYYNQNRLHLGYHYSRDYNTRKLCKDNYYKFINTYGFAIDNIKNNYYVISNESIIDFNTFKHIYTYEGYDLSTIDNNNIFENIQQKIFKVDERVINSDKIKKFFKESLKNTKTLFSTKVISYKKNGEKIILNTNNYELQCDILLDCTYNQLGLSKLNYTYELTISLVFERVHYILFDALTIMDGKFCSLYPREIDKNLFSLTDVEYTPLISSENYLDICNYNVTQEKIEETKNNMINKINNYYPNFENDFKYISYFLAKKTKLKSCSDSREITIEEIEENVYSVNCGKIYGIFEFEKFILEKLID